MFFLDTSVEKCSKTYLDLFDDINKKIYQYGKIVLNNRRFGFDKKVNHNNFEDLLIYRDILKVKLECDDCLCDYSIDSVVSKIKELTLSIC